MDKASILHLYEFVFGIENNSIKEINEEMAKVDSKGIIMCLDFLNQFIDTHHLSIKKASILSSEIVRSRKYPKDNLFKVNNFFESINRCVFLVQMIALKVFSIDEIAKYVIEYFQEIINPQQQRIVFKYFGYSFAESDKELYDELTLKFSKENEYFNDLHFYLHPQIYALCSETLLEIIIDDDVDRFKSFSLDPKFDFNQSILDPNQSISENNTLLEISCYWGSIKIVKYIILHKIKFTEKTLYASIRSGKTELIRMHLQAKVNMTKSIEWAIESHQNDIFDWLMENIVRSVKPQNIFNIAAKTGNIHVADFCLSNFKDVVWEDALELAVNRNGFWFVSYLMALPSNGKEIKRSLLCSAASISTSFTDLMLSFGIDANATNKRGDSALHIAVSNGNPETVKLLISKGAKVNTFNSINETPLFWAALNNHLDCAIILIENGADINALNDRFETPLIAACKSSSNDVAKYLLAQRDIDIKNIDMHGKCASDYSNQEIFKLLNRHVI